MHQCVLQTIKLSGDMSSFAPIVLFVYNRLDHTKKTIEALQKNELADQSELFIYSDAPKNEQVVSSTNSVRQYLRCISGFKKVTVIERETNFGLAKNIIKGVTEVCNRYGKVIIIEDDVVTSPQFLTFMNTALDKYINEPSVWHISGWNYPIDPDGLGDAFFWRAMNCWGWATWADRWQYFVKDPGHLVENWDKGKVKRFNLDGAYNFWLQVKLNHSGKINTWAIFWYSTIFANAGLCLNPAQSLVANIGHDGSGENCERDEVFSAMDFFSPQISNLPDQLVESTLAIQRISQFYSTTQSSLLKRLIRRIKLIIYKGQN
jgi:hypothetical protein